MIRSINKLTKLEEMNELLLFVGVLTFTIPSTTSIPIPATNTTGTVSQECGYLDSQLE